MRLIYARAEPTIDLLLPQEQTGFRHGRSIIDQVTSLTHHVEESISAKKKAGDMFAYFTVDSRDKVSEI